MGTARLCPPVLGPQLGWLHKAGDRSHLKASRCICLAVDVICWLGASVPLHVVLYLASFGLPHSVMLVSSEQAS